SRLPDRTYTIVCSILADKNPDAMLATLAAVGDTFVATESANRRAIPASELARIAAGHFPTVESVPDPSRALERARSLAGPDGAVLVTGSLYLLAALSLDA
ncbi:MAG TPA: hypothetical protein VG265_08055, partial [Gaiellaceae bacterium]|nr:hypothetical protein [Gaiellaceae bacterium]